jgi:drug/metabolite transporter (DMT)-like permease
MTTADHGAFLIQLTTLIVPTVQGIMGVPISMRIQTAVALAVAGVALFTQDTQTTTAAMTILVPDGDLLLLQQQQQLLGDALCVVAAAFYATYDLRLYRWGKRIAPRPLMTRKILVQTVIAIAAAACYSAVVGSPSSAAVLDDSSVVSLFSWDTLAATADAVASSSSPTMVALIVWSGVVVNCVVPFLQVQGQQAIGPTRSQTIYASQPLWAAVLAYFWLGETVGFKGMVGGGAFVVALFLAATAPPPPEQK